jgi:hypothetical protein
MIDIRYHVATIVAIFLALAVGILIGSTLIGSDVLVEQQKKMISQLETQFTSLKQRENQLMTENKFTTQVSRYYEEYSQEVSPPIIKNRLRGYRLAVIITGGQGVSSGLVNTLSLAGASINSTTVMLPALKLDNAELNIKLCDYYKLDHNTPPDELRKMVALSVAGIISSGADKDAQSFLQDNGLIKLNGDYGGVLNGVIIIGGSQDPKFNYAENIDSWIIRSLLNSNQRVFGCETSRVTYSYMKTYQKFDISTVDDIDLTPGQVALVRAIEGEAGDYGVKSTAKRFMPSLPSEFLGGAFR